MIDNKLSGLICVILGFEFESKITPFGAKNFYENLTVFLVVGYLSLNELETKEQFRLYILTLFVTGVLSLLLLFKVQFKIR